jgi:hypothetical protein
MSMDQAAPNRFARDSIEEFLNKRIAITVKWVDSSEPQILRVSVHLKDTIGDAKAKLVPLTKIPVADQVLVYNTEELADGEQFYKGTFADRVSIELRGQKTQVFVKDLLGKTMVMSFSPSETLLDFKNRLEVRTGVPVREQRLNVEGRPLTDNNALMKSLRIGRDATLHLLMRLRGGYEVNL